jgi:large repetitive protein
MTMSNDNRTSWNRGARSTRVVIAALALVMALWAKPASAQAINLGTYSIGEVWAQLFGTAPWSIAPGSSLPPGLSLRTDVPPWFNPTATAGIIGVATTPGSYSFTLLANGSPQSYQITISPLVIKDNWTLPDGHVGVSYSYGLSALNNVGGTSWSINGSVPPGISLNALTGELSGSPTQAGIYDFNVTVNDGVNSGFRGFRLYVYDLTITTPGSLPNATQGVAYATSLSASGGSGGYTYTTSGGLPAGVTLDPGGLLSGTPTNGGSHSWFTVTATDNTGHSVVKTMSIVTLSAPIGLPRVTPSGSFFDDCTIGDPCILQMEVQSGGRAPFAWSVTGLPPGMSFRSSTGNEQWWLGPENVELWGTPTALGSYHVQATVTDADGRSATNTFDLYVQPLHLWNYTPNGQVGTPYNHTFKVLGGRGPYTAALVSGRLALGLTFNPATLTISGTPTEAGNFRGVFEFTDADGETLLVSNYFTIGGGASTLLITSNDDLGTISAGAAYSNQLQACCAPSLVWSIASGSLPSGLALSPDGLLSGTPPTGTSGTFTFLVRVQDGTNLANTVVRQFTILVTPLTASSNLPPGNVGVPYSGSLSATGGTGITWTLEPNQYLPPGLTLATTGAISGTPLASGFSSFRARATDSAGNVLIRNFSISIYPAGQTPPLALIISNQSAAIGSFTLQLSASGGTAPYTYSLSPGATAVPGMRIQNGPQLPTNFAASVSGGFLGVLTAPGSHATSIRVTDALGATFDRAFTINVTPMRIVSNTSLPRPTLGVPYSFDLTIYGGGPFTLTASGLPP